MDDVKIEIWDRQTASWFDITPWITWQGLTFSRNDVDGPNAGRDMGGNMHRDRVSIKEKMNVTTIQLGKVDTAKLYGLLEPESINVRVTQYPPTNSVKTMTMYSNNVKTTFVRKTTWGDNLYTLSFPLIEN